jgi:3-dehydroquinate synthetase
LAKPSASTPSSTQTVPKVITVTTPSRRYDVTIGRGLFSSLGSTTRNAVGPAAKRAAIIADKNIPSELLSLADVSLSRAGFFVARVSIEATEANKSLRALEGLSSFLASMKLERTEPVVAIGGGIVGDLAGFAAAIHRRGCPVIQCPTTLLAMVDASVGGKTGVNLSIPSGNTIALLKNALGAFHQPHAVVADLATLDSLPPREFNAGLAECVKHALLGGAFGEPKLLEWMESATSEPRPSGRGPLQPSATSTWPAASLAELIARNVAIKAQVVANDEREEAALSQGGESGGRALLNLGHTFAHAIETLPDLSFSLGDASSKDHAESTTHGPLLHGEAVALGLIAASHLGVALNHCDATLPARITNLLRALHLPTHVHGLPAADAILARMAHDKKSSGGSLRLIVPTNTPRTAIVVTNPPRDAMLSAIEAMTR